MIDASNPSVTPTGLPKFVWVVGECETTLWGVSQLERIRRAFGRAGIHDVRSGGADCGDSQSAALIRADVVLEQPVVAALAKTPNSILAMPAGAGNWIAGAANVPATAMTAVARLMGDHSISGADAVPAGLVKLSPAELASSYNHELRKRAVPYALSLSTTSAIEAEQAMFQASYKGVTDFVTKWLWPWPAFWATRWCANLGITPNTVTTVSFLLMLAAMVSFGDGLFLTGLVAAWGMTFLDTVDGKLARVTLTTSRWGNVFDHGIDLLHPPFWYWAWWFALIQFANPGQTEFLTEAFWVIVGGYILGRLQEGVFIWQFGIEMHAWRPMDSWFRLYTARRNPNLVLLTLAALAGEPAFGFLAVAVWTILSLLFHFVRIGQAFLARGLGQPVRSWLTEPVAAVT